MTAAVAKTRGYDAHLQFLQIIRQHTHEFAGVDRAEQHIVDLQIDGQCRPLHMHRLLSIEHDGRVDYFQRDRRVVAAHEMYCQAAMEQLRAPLGLAYLCPGVNRGQL
jgi:hypothetical protein